MRSRGGVICIAILQLVVGLVILAVYEGYKTEYFEQALGADFGSREKSSIGAADAGFQPREGIVSISLKSPLDFLYWFSILTNVNSMFGLAGVINHSKSLVLMFFAVNAIQTVVSFHVFVDVCATIGIRFSPSDHDQTTPYEKVAATFIFFNFLLSGVASITAVRAMNDMRQKQREYLETGSQRGADYDASLEDLLGDRGGPLKAGRGSTTPFSALNTMQHSLTRRQD